MNNLLWRRIGFLLILFSMSATETPALSTWLNPAAHPTAWLLIGIKGYENEALEWKFRRAFEKQFINVEIRRSATQEHLFDALNNPNSVVVLWIGHGQRLSDGLLSPAGVIRDANDSDVTSIFKSVHPNIRWLGVLGCESESFINEYRQLGYYKSNPLLHILDFPGWIELSENTQRTISVIMQNWVPLTPQICAQDTQRALPITIKVEMPSSSLKNAPPVRIQLKQDRVLAVFPSMAAGEKAIAGGSLTAEDFHQNHPFQIEVIVSTPRFADPEPEFAKLSFYLNGNEVTLTPALDREGRPLGKTRRVYEFTVLPLPELSLPRRPGSC